MFTAQADGQGDMADSMPKGAHTDKIVDWTAFSHLTGSECFGL